MYSDIRVGRAVLAPVVIGAVVNLPGRSEQGAGSIIAFGRIAGVTVAGDFNGDIISYTGGLGPVTITNGSFLPGNLIAAYDGNVESVTITNGNLYGNITSDYNITAVRVVAGADGIFGDVGVNPFIPGGEAYDALRSKLPPGVAIDATYQGPRLTAGHNLVSFVVTNGSVFEASFHAGRAIAAVSITGSVGNDTITPGYGSYFTAGASIDAVAITGGADAAVFLAGVVGLGADNRPGGLGVNADTLRAGTISIISADRAESRIAGVDTAPTGSRTHRGQPAIRSSPASTAAVAARNGGHGPRVWASPRHRRRAVLVSGTGLPFFNMRSVYALPSLTCRRPTSTTIDGVGIAAHRWRRPAPSPSGASRPSCSPARARPSSTSRPRVISAGRRRRLSVSSSTGVLRLRHHPPPTPWARYHAGRDRRRLGRLHRRRGHLLVRSSPRGSVVFGGDAGTLAFASLSGGTSRPGVRSVDGDYSASAARPRARSRRLPLRRQRHDRGARTAGHRGRPRHHHLRRHPPRERASRGGAIARSPRASASRGCRPRFIRGICRRRGLRTPRSWRA